MDGGLSFIVITIGKLGIALGTAIGFSSGLTWFYKNESKSSKNGGKRHVQTYEGSDIRERLNNLKQ